MERKFNGKLARTAMLAGASAVALASAGEARAADFQTITFTSIQGSGPNAANSFCDIAVLVTGEGDVNDSNNRDFWQIDVRDSQGAVPPNYNGQSFAGDFFDFGQVQTKGRGIRAFVSQSAHVPAYITAFDPTTLFPPSSPPQSLAELSVRIPDADLKAAGGGCLFLRENNEPDAATQVSFGPSRLSNTEAGFDITGTATDLDNDALTFTWTQISGPTPAASTTFGVTNGQTLRARVARAASAQTLVFEFTADDGRTTTTEQISVVIPANTAPTAVTGPDRTIASNSTITLDGRSSTDGDGDAITYSWAQISGPTVTINNPSSSQATFQTGNPPAVDTDYVFELTVSDAFGSSTDTVTLTQLANLPPNVNAGPDQTVGGGQTVELGATASDPESDLITLQWTQTGGPAVTLTNPNSLSTNFTAPPKTNAQQVLTFEFSASDNQGNTTTDTVQVFVIPNAGPTADAGPDQNVSGNSPVTLDASASFDGDGDPIAFSWVQTGGPAVTLSNANSAQPTFTSPTATNAVQTLTFEVTVDDGLATATDTVVINVAPNNAPMADAGPDQTVDGGDTVTLDGTGSMDADGDPLTYSFVQTAGTAVTLTNANTATPTFTAPPKTATAQVLRFTLTVNDGNATATDTVEITVAANGAPVADAGADQAVSGDDAVTLDATGSSDPDGDSLTYSFVQTAGPAVTLTGANTATPTFTAPQGIATAQTLTFEVTVSDGIGTSTDTVDVVVAPNAPPVADAGVDQGPIDSGQTVTLDGSGSSDPDNDALTYTWTQVSGTAVTLSNANSVNPTFTAPLVNGTENLVFQLIVNDGQADSPPDTVTIAIRAVGTITIVTNVIGDDVAVGYTSDVAALNTSVTTSGGVASLTATNVAAGSYTFGVQDLRSQGYALTDITCNDNDSTVSLANSSIGIALSPSEDLVCTVTLADSRSAATQAIENFLTGRNALLLSNQPDLQRRIDRLNGTSAGGSTSVAGFGIPGSGALPFSALVGNGQLSFKTSLAMAAQATGDVERQRAIDVWAEVRFADVTIGQNKGNFMVGYLGVDVLVNEDVLVGALGQFDRFDRDGGVSAPGSAEGDGWMVGPYVTARLAPRFYADARVAYGRSDNSLSPLGTYVDGFETERFLASGSLLGDIPLGRNATLWPEVAVRYIREDSQAYTDSLNVQIPGQTVDQGELALSPRLDFRLDTQGGWMVRPYVEAEGLLTFGSSGNSVVDNGLRGRLGAGVDANSAQGFRVNLAGFYDGIGEENYEAAGVSVGISFSF